MTDDPAQISRPVTSSKVVRSPRAEALLGAAPAEQIAQALSAERWARAADLIAHFGERLLLEEGTGALAAHLEALPEAVLAKNPRVAVIAAWVALYQQRYHDARQRLSQAERAQKQLDLADTAPAEEVELTPHAEVKQSLAALRLHLMALSEGRLPQDVVDIMIPASADHPLWRAGALLTLGRCRIQAGQLAAAREDLEAALMFAETTRGNRAQRTAAEAMVLLGTVAEAEAALGEAQRRYTEVARRADDAKSSLTPYIAAAQVGLASVALARLDLAAAQHALTRARELSTTLPSATSHVHLTVDLGLLEVALHALTGQPDKARVALDQVERAMTAVKLRWPLERLGVERARLALLRGDDSTARRWLQQRAVRSGEGRAPTNPLEAAATLMSAQVRLALRQPVEARADANAALALAEQLPHRRLAIDALTLLALAQFAAGERDAARSALVAALEAASAERLASSFVHRGLADMAAEVGVDHPLLQQAAAKVPNVTQPPRERPPTRAVASGPIETAQLPASSDAEPAAPERFEAEPEPAALAQEAALLAAEPEPGQEEPSAASAPATQAAVVG